MIDEKKIKDLGASSRAFEKLKEIWLPTIFPNYEITSIENNKDKTLNRLDTQCGIDFFIENGEGMRGGAFRAQWGTNYRSFTIRKERHTTTRTEYEKTMDHIANDYIYPYWTIQTYFNNREENKPLGLGLIKTYDLYQHVLSAATEINKSDNSFMVVRWDNLADISSFREYKER